MSSAGEMLDKLREFYEDLKEYREMLSKDQLAKESEPQERKREELREKLVRKSGELKSVVVNVTKEQYMTVKESGMRFDLWSESLTRIYASHRFQATSYGACRWGGARGVREKIGEVV